MDGSRVRWVQVYMGRWEVTDEAVDVAMTELRTQTIKRENTAGRRDILQAGAVIEGRVQLQDVLLPYTVNLLRLPGPTQNKEYA